MKNLFAGLLAAGSLATFSLQAETTTKISDVHLCCQSCVKGVDKALAETKDVTATVDKDAGTVTLTGPDKASVQKAADALVAAGYFGKSSNKEIKLASNTGAQDKKVESMKLEGVHLCCPK